MNLLIIQARMGSSRLPGKVLKEIKNHSLLEILYMRVKSSKYVDAIVIATTNNQEDDAIELFCSKNNISCYRGSDWDVLDRYYKVCEKYSPDNVIRITSDCPLHHYSVIDFVFSEYLKSGKDYFSNSNNEPLFLEDGFDVEVFSFEALKIAYNDSKLLSEREHVTPYIKNCGKFTCGWKKYNKEYNFKLSVDTINDFKVVETIFNYFDSLINFEMKDIIELLNLNPNILQLNKDSVINSGYLKSIKNDKKI